jgi:hypothetical protein
MHLEAAKQTAYIVEHSKGDFRAGFNRSCFQFSHNLSDHPLFSVGSLISAAERIAQYGYYDTGEIAVHQRWDETPPRPYPVVETMERIQTSEAWVSLNQAQRIPEYGAIVDEYLAEVEEMIGQRFAPVMRNKEMILFLSSPNRITPYHLDRECSFLLQVRGEKTIHTFQGTDRSIVTEEELERFWTVDNGAATYRPEIESKAKIFHLKPGDAMHIPVNFPHWVQNGSDVSVSVNINLQFLDHLRANLYRANYHLRRRGFSPSPPGRSKWKDALKLAAYENAMRIKGRLGRRRDG